MQSFLAIVDKKGYNKHDAMGVLSLYAFLATHGAARTQIDRGYRA